MNRIGIFAIETKWPKTPQDRLVSQIAAQDGMQEGEAGLKPSEDGFWLARGEADAAYADGDGALYRKLVASGFPKCKDTSQFFTKLSNYIVGQTVPAIWDRFCQIRKLLGDSYDQKYSPLRFSTEDRYEIGPHIDLVDHKLVIPIEADGSSAFFKDFIGLEFTLGHEAGHLYLLTNMRSYLTALEEEQLCDILAVLNLLRNPKATAWLRDHKDEWGDRARSWVAGPAMRQRAPLLVDMLHAAFSPLPLNLTGYTCYTRPEAMEAVLAGHVAAIAYRKATPPLINRLIGELWPAPRELEIPGDLERVAAIKNGRTDPVKPAPDGHFAGSDPAKCAGGVHLHATIAASSTYVSPGQARPLQGKVFGFPTGPRLRYPTPIEGLQSITLNAICQEAAGDPADDALVAYLAPPRVRVWGRI